MPLVARVKGTWMPSASWVMSTATTAPGDHSVDSVCPFTLKVLPGETSIRLANWPVAQKTSTPRPPPSQL